MKLDKVVVPKFTHTDEFGSFEARDVEILFDSNENAITPEGFQQNRHSYFLSSDEIRRLSTESAQRFYDLNYSVLLKGKRTLSPKEIAGIKNLLQVSGVELGTLLGLDKSSASRILTGKQDLQRDKMMLLMERMRDELTHPGSARFLIDHIQRKQSRLGDVETINLPAIEVAEYFVRSANRSNAPVTHLKLQKLLYYAQGIGFGRSNVKLIREPFLAWEHGPVIREVYDAFKTQDRNPLPTNPLIDLGKIEGNETVLAILEETLSLYSPYEAWHLREKTHRESPWLETDRDGVISDEKFIAFFRKAVV